MVVLVSLALLQAGGCATGSRKPASAASDAEALAASKNFHTITGKFLEYVLSDQFNAESCSPFLNEVYSQIFAAPVSYFDLSHLDAEATGIIRNLFRTRLEMRRKLALFSVAGAATEECVNSMRNVLRAVRFAEDYVGEFQVRPKPFDAKNPAIAFAGAEPHTMVNSYYLPFDIEANVRSGDVLLSRGAAFTSAAIARLGDVDSQFSHAALVYIDSETHEKYTIEAHIEIGVVVAPFKKYLGDGKVRSALFRYGDPVLAHEAARIMYEKAKAAMDRKENIHYDFTLDVKDHSSIFCSEVVATGFEEASKGRVMVPMFMSRVTPKNRSFVDRLGVTATQSYMPGDTEVDPRFELIAEWRDFSRMRATRYKDAVLTKVYEWIETKNYTFDPTAFTKAASGVAWVLRHTPFVGLLLEEKFPPYMARKILETIGVLNDTVSPIEAKLAKQDEARIRATGFPMTAHELYEELERMREEDQKTYASGGKSLFHKIFHP